MSYALITGASKGIGKALAEALAAKKHNLILVARSESLLQSLSHELRNKYEIMVAYYAIDLSDANAIEKLKQWCDDHAYPVDILINNAGFGLNGAFEVLTWAEQQNMMQLNMNALVQLCHAFLPVLKIHEKAYILNVSSTTAYQAIPYMSLYAASKAFVLAFTRGLKHELSGSHISVSCLVPGSTATDFSNRAGVSEELQKKGENVIMSAESVAKIALAGMYAGKAEIIPGFVNKIGAFFPRLLPKALPEKIALGLYKP